MGRRKIEIQPIQHDRNRSVTFLKRKNGLFKKAYELGVLCSADVAVIVFGHNTKLYEYCSTDINVLLQRQREYSGERDTKGPSDYSADKGDGADDDSD
ncbi:myocyte enhancer factor 2D, partial [Calocera cornea HHB12733]